MNLYFINEGRFVRKGENVYSINGNFTNRLWERYLTVFDKIYIIARVTNDNEIETRFEYLANNDKVSFIDLPYYIGPYQYLKVQNKIRETINKNLSQGNVYICRVPGQIGYTASKLLSNKNIPYGVEVVGDPWDIYTVGSINHPLRFFFRYKGYFDLKKIINNSAACIFVTQETLQKKYLKSKDTYQIAASDVYLDENNIADQAHILTNKEEYNLISIGSLAQLYKAPDIVLEALQILQSKGYNCKLTWLGEGKYKGEMISLAEKLGLTDNVYFIGNVPPEEVVNNLIKSDIFLLVSRTEGLPRAIIEAMAMGLPCIGSNVGGIPELLDKDVIIQKEDSKGLADKIEYMIKNKTFSNMQALRNLSESKNYSDSVLKEKREKFYNKLIQLSKPE